MSEEDNVFRFGIEISKKGFMKYIVILLRIQENRKKYKKSFVLLG